MCCAKSPVAPKIIITKGLFTVAGIKILEDLASNIGEALLRKQAEEKLLIVLQESDILRQKAENLNKEKELLLKETHHRIKNNMNIIYSLLTLQANAHEEINSAAVLNDAAIRVQSMAVLYDKLYRTQSYDMLNIKLFLPPLIDEIITVFHTKVLIQTDIHIDDFTLKAEILSPLGIIINELITNSMKYAFKGIDSGIISVSACKKGNSVTIVYGDNGIGLPESITFETSSGFGMQLIEMLVQQLHGSLTIDRNKGTKFTITLMV